MSEQIRPWDTLACCWDVKQPTNKQSLGLLPLPPSPPPPHTHTHPSKPLSVPSSPSSVSAECDVFRAQKMLNGRRGRFIWVDGCWSLPAGPVISSSFTADRNQLRAPLSAGRVFPLNRSLRFIPLCYRLFLVGCSLNVPATCTSISETDERGKLHVLPHRN